VLALDTGGLHGWQRVAQRDGVSGLQRLYGWPGGEARPHPLDARAPRPVKSPGRSLPR
jgi:hypothetical protein